MAGLENYDNKDIDLKKGTMTESKEKPKTLTQMLAPKFEAFGTTPEVVKEHFLQVVSINPELEKAKPETLLLAIAQTIHTGVSLNPQDGEVGLIPYKQGMGTVAQLQYMWKGYRRIIKRDILGVKDLVAIPVKEGDIQTWDYFTGEATYNQDIFTNDFAKQQERRKLKTIGYAGFVLLDKEIYGADNLMSYMSLEDIKEHKEEFGSKTKISDHKYNTKTLAKKAYRDFMEIYKDKMKFNVNGSRKAMLSALKYDQAVQTAEGIEYVEKGE